MTWEKNQLKFEIICNINEGLSNSIKQKVTDEYGNVYMRRVMRYSSTLNDILEQYKEIGTSLRDDRLVKIIDISKDAGKIVLLTEWVDGNTLESLLPAMSDDEAFQMGIRSAILLRSIHEAGGIVVNDCVTEKFICDEIEKYMNINGEDKLYKLVYKNMHILLDNHDKVFLHSDYHVGNILLNRNGKLIVVDLEKCETGSVYRDLGVNETYNFIVSSCYAKGLLHEYSKNQGFTWKLYGINIAFFMMVYCNWKSKKNEMYTYVLNSYIQRHDMNAFGVPLWINR